MPSVATGGHDVLGPSPALGDRVPLPPRVDALPKEKPARVLPEAMTSLRAR